MDIAKRLATALADRYSIERLLGRGGMAQVFLAQDLKHDRRVAIKVLHPEIAETLGPDRFLRERKTIAPLQHPHIVPLFDSGEADGLLYYVMPYVEGETLRERLNREKQLDLDDALQITREATDALIYAHGKNVVHRDIKPENILLSGGHALVSDFGISREAASGEPLTVSGVAIGTPEYMSPEQATASPDVDARSDVYALGCVLYEMLVGEPPFTGPTVQAIIARHVNETPPSIRVVRPGVPLSIEQVINKSLEKSPADRFSSAMHMQTALAAASRKSRATQLLRSRRRWIFGTGAAVVALAVISVLAATQLRPEESLELDLYVITSFDHREGAAPTLLNGDMCEFHLSRAFEEFIPSIRTVGKWRVTEQRRAAGVAEMMHKDWLRIAKEFGAGNLVEGEVAQYGDTVELRAILYETRRRGKQRNSARVRFVLGVDDRDAAFRQLAADLLDLPIGPGGKPTTWNLRAAEAFNQGWTAFEEWDLVSAERGFREAVTRDPQYADAHLWLAHALLWQERSEWRQAVVDAYRLRGRLAQRDQLRVAALKAQAEQQFPQMCEQYETLIEQDSGDVLAWIGLGDCHRLDRAVLPDTLSPSGWRFRTSYNSAVSAYRHALDLLPSFGRVVVGRTYQPLFRVLYVYGNVVRGGRAVAPDTGSFAAYTELDADTLVHVPYRLDMFAHIRPPASANQVVTRNRRIFADLALRWVATLPQSSQAHSQRGFALELLGQIDSTRYGDSSAFAEVRRARQVARDPEEELGPAIAEVRLLIKSQQLVRARVLAESVLAQWPDPDPFQAHELVGLAALTGKVYRAGELAERSAPMFRESPGQLADVPLPVLEARERLRVYAALGAPVESLPSLTARTDTLLNAWVRGTVPAALRYEVLDIPMALAFPWIGVSDIHRPAARDLLIQFQWALVRGDSAGLRQRLDSLRIADRALQVPLWAVYGEAWLMLQLGDTNAAVEHLESSISPAVIPTLSPRFITSPINAAAFVRSMALRAEVAAASGEAAIASQWARRVVALWDGAEADLRPLVEVMRRLQGPAEQ